MTFYNMLFGMNNQADFLLAVVMLKRNDVERFRDVHANADGSEIRITSRTGGGNREGYPNILMRSLPGWLTSEDDDFDCTYCYDKFAVDEKWRADVVALRDPLANGFRKEFGQHLAKTLNREPTESDLANAAYDKEAEAIRRLWGVKANGHTFVPYDDYAMEQALKLAEANGGILRSCWGILPLTLEATLAIYRPIKPKNQPEYVECTRAKINCQWRIDEVYLTHCVTRFSSLYPKAMAQVVKESERFRASSKP